MSESEAVATQDATTAIDDAVPTTPPRPSPISSRDRSDATDQSASWRHHRRSMLIRQDGRSARALRVNEMPINSYENQGGVPQQEVYVRAQSESRPMTFWMRIRTKYFCCKQAAEEEKGAKRRDSTGMHRLQYRLEATVKRNKNALRALTDFLYVGTTQGEAALRRSSDIDPNQLLINYLYWVFRQKYAALFILSLFFFFGLVLLFTLLIAAAHKLDSDCVGGSGVGYYFSLSWTTFSTVGYGNTAPALSNAHNNKNQCMFIALVCSLESFVGVLYAGFCGAILFGKVVRVQSHAQVVFSDPIVIRYGDGVDTFDDAEPEEADGNLDKEAGGGTADIPQAGGGVTFSAGTVVKRRKIPCPVLEFRIANRLHSEIGGEIVDATLNCVANVDADDADPDLRDATDRLRVSLSANTSVSSGEEGGDGTSVRMGGDDSERLKMSHYNMMVPLTQLAHMGSRGLENVAALNPMAFMGGKKDHQAVAEDPSSNLVPKRIFSKLYLEAYDHPFFKRVWLARHVLDATSPLLTPKARRLVRRNRGCWPEQLNNYEGVRESIQFNQLLVSMHGISNISASSVYAQKIYDFVDCNVGYKFVNILYRGTDGKLHVDLDMINDVREQKGGGGEPLV